MSKSKKVYYHVELPLEMVKILSSVCQSYARVIAGDVTAIKEIVTEAYEQRIGRKPTSEVQNSINELSRQLVSIGWDTNVSTSYAHRFRKESDTLFDISEVLRYQMAIRVEISEVVDAPKHWNPEIELPRIIRIIESSAKRIKQLRIFQGQE